MPKVTTVSTGRRGDGAIVRMQLHGDDLSGIGEEMLDEMVPRGKEAVKSLRDRIYEDIRGNLSFRTREPARPGDPPRMVTAELYRSVRRRAVRVSRDRRMIQSAIHVNHPGANRLEFGKVDRLGRRTFAHPFVRPAFARAQSIARRLFGTI